MEDDDYDDDGGLKFATSSFLHLEFQTLSLLEVTHVSRELECSAMGACVTELHL